MSELVRRAVARELGSSIQARKLLADGPIGSTPSGACVKLSIRMAPDEARRLADGAKAAGMSRAAYLAGLVADVPVLTAGGKRNEHLAP